MNNVIELLKKNEKPSCLLSSEMQDFILGCKAEDLEYLSSSSRRGSPEWRINANSPDEIKRTPLATYRLRDTYADEPEIVECEIYTVAAIHGFHTELYDFGEEHELTLALIPNGYKRTGFRFADGTVMGSPVKYSVPGMTSKGYYASYEDLKTGQALEHHATHVLFRQKKQE